MDPIWFNSKSAFAWLSNLSAHSVTTICGRTYPSIEHAYQAEKFERDDEVYNRVCSAPTPAAAKAAAAEAAARACEYWTKMRDPVMQSALAAKFSQHPDLRDQLLNTGDCPLIHESDSDAYWGRRREDGRGTNRLGLMLEELREDFRRRRLAPRGAAAEEYPECLVVHAPHAATCVPASVRDQFLLDDDALAVEIAETTDHRTVELFTSCRDRHRVVRAGVARAVVDVERFIDERESLAACGRGAIYHVTSNLSPLRRSLSEAERTQLLSRYYNRHHRVLEDAVHDAIRRTGECVILDAHSFPDRPLGYEVAATDAARPDVCLGVDADHTSPQLVDCFRESFRAAGLSTAVNLPFAGTIVPVSMLGTDPRVQSIMVEINRRLYLRRMDEVVEDFDAVAATVRGCCVRALREAGFK